MCETASDAHAVLARRLAWLERTCSPLVIPQPAVAMAQGSYLMPVGYKWVQTLR